MVNRGLAGDGPAGTPRKRSRSLVFLPGGVDRTGYGPGLRCPETGTAGWRPGPRRPQRPFVAAYQHVANLAHNLVSCYPVTGITVKTVWCPADINWVANAVTTTYPGDTYVDIGGPDCYSNIYPDDLQN